MLLAMDREGRSGDTYSAVDGFFSGPGASVEANLAALERARTARSVVLVEGISDQIAIEAAAVRLSRNLYAEGVVVVPMGGAHEIFRHLDTLDPRGQARTIVGMCDAAEEPIFRDSLTFAGLGSPRTRRGLERLGFFVCVDDLEQELIRASHRAEIEGLLDLNGDLNSFRILQRQPAWRGHEFEDQFHRWLRAGAGRHLRYAHLLTSTIQRLPTPLVKVLEASRPRGEP